jgi:hypothetical protein
MGKKRISEHWLVELTTGFSWNERNYSAALTVIIIIIIIIIRIMNRNQWPSGPMAQYPKVQDNFDAESPQSCLGQPHWWQDVLLRRRSPLLPLFASARCLLFSGHGVTQHIHFGCMELYSRLRINN